MNIVEVLQYVEVSEIHEICVYWYVAVCICSLQDNDSIVLSSILSVVCVMGDLYMLQSEGNDGIVHVVCGCSVGRKWTVLCVKE